MPNMTGRPGHWTMEMNGGSSAPYLARTPCVPSFLHCLKRVEAEGLLDYQGRARIISIVRWNLRPVIFGVEKSSRRTKWGWILNGGGFPDFPETSRFVPVCPLLSFSGPERGQIGTKRTNGDKTVHFGQFEKRPHLASTPI